MNESRRPVAAIDLGTNTALLLVARSAPGLGLEVLAQDCEVVRLGERPRSAGEAGGQGLSPEAVERTLRALGRFKAKAVGMGVVPERLRVTATAVLRRASDAAAFVQRCEDELGLRVEILSGSEEARLGRSALGSAGTEEWVTLDVGGGSTELAGEGPGEQISAPVGALVLTEQFLGMGSNAPLEPGGAAGLWEQVRASFGCFPTDFARGRTVVLLGGSASNLACLEKGLEQFDPLQVEGTHIDVCAARAWGERLIDMSPEDRAHLPIESQRVEILPAGLICIAAGLERIEAGEARISALGLRHGVALELLHD
ncbi:MAG: hypothetical protein CMJ98_02410 [Planctomycetes bacterium]|nr:hypothetical protein [Planctomycetota bacterium]MBV21744.1 hypothetical protein [Planctomycetaceae bacterium]HJM58852.1 hypothetical protein [Planctomycetota bacterium]